MFILVFNCLSYYIEKQFIEFYMSTVYLVMLLRLLISFSRFFVVVVVVDSTGYSAQMSADESSFIPLFQTGCLLYHFLI